MDVAIRPVEATDHEDVMRLAPRLLVGVDPSRPTDLVRTAIQDWVDESVKSAGSDGQAGWVADTTAPSSGSSLCQQRITGAE